MRTRALNSGQFGREDACPGLRRRSFLACFAAATAGSSLGLLRAVEPSVEDAAILEKIAAHRPSRLAKLPPDFRARIGAAHVAGRYHLTQKPFLIEGAEKLLELGTRLGKFWFIPESVANSSPT